MTYWGEGKRMNESVDDHALRLERRQMLDSLRAQAETVRREGREYKLIRIPAEYRSSV